MKVSELIAALQAMPQDMDVYVLDADEGNLLRMEAGDVEAKKADKNYPFECVQIATPYSDGVGERRTAMVRWW